MAKRLSLEERYNKLVQIMDLVKYVTENSSILTPAEKKMTLGDQAIDRQDVEECFQTKNTSGLSQMEKIILTPWNENYDEDSELFWRLAKEKGIDIQRVDYLSKILKRGKIANFTEYEFLNDAIVILEQEGKVSESEAMELKAMIGKFEERGA